MYVVLLLLSFSCVAIIYLELMNIKIKDRNRRYAAMVEELELRKTIQARWADLMICIKESPLFTEEFKQRHMRDRLPEMTGHELVLEYHRRLSLMRIDLGMNLGESK